jgi:hypothetical protein
MRAFIAGLLIFAVPLAGAAAEARKYAVVSLLGDRLLIVTKDMSTGSRLDRNTRAFVELSNPALDNDTAFAIEDSLKKSGAGSEVVVLAVRDPRVFALQRSMLEGSGETAEVLTGLRAALGQVKATHLVLATKYRHDSLLRMADGYVGSGSLEGLGFYIDHIMRVQTVETGEHATGFLAAFAYFRLSLIDLAGWKVVREERVLGSTVQSAVSSKSGHPWEAMSSTAKVRALQGIIRREVMAAVPKLVSE